MEHAVIVTTIPKAGTYFMAQMLDRLGIRDSHLHLVYEAVSNGIREGYLRHEDDSIENYKRYPDRFFRSAPIGQALELIGPKSFAVGHLLPTSQLTQLLAGSKVIFLVRNIRTCLVSHMRFQIDRGDLSPGADPWIAIADPKQRFLEYISKYAIKYDIIETFKRCASWQYRLEDPQIKIMKVHYEELVDVDSLKHIFSGLAAFLDVDVSNIEVASMLDSVTRTKTITLSEGPRSMWEEYWSPEAEGWFQANIMDARGNNMNRLIGYDD